MCLTIFSFTTSSVLTSASSTRPPRLVPLPPRLPPLAGLLSLISGISRGYLSLSSESDSKLQVCQTEIGWALIITVPSCLTHPVGGNLISQYKCNMSLQSTLLTTGAMLLTQPTKTRGRSISQKKFQKCVGNFYFLFNLYDPKMGHEVFYSKKV